MDEPAAVVQCGPSGDPSAPEPAYFPGEKAANAVAAGYEAVLSWPATSATLSRRHPTRFGRLPEDQETVGVWTTHTAFHLMFNTTPEFTLPPATAAQGNQAWCVLARERGPTSVPSGARQASRSPGGEARHLHPGDAKGSLAPLGSWVPHSGVSWRSLSPGAAATSKGAHVERPSDTGAGAS
jgi:hypothetical protein